MSTQVRVPALPESVADATLLVWHKQPGERVKKDENLVDLETDKVVLEVPAPADGVLGEFQAQEGDLVEADAILAMIEEGIGDAPTSAVSTEDGALEKAAGLPAGHADTLTQPSLASIQDGRPSVTPSSASSKVSETGEAQGLGSAPKAPVLAPAARRLIKELGLDASRIPGTGKDGRINKADVMAWLDRQEAEVTDRDPDLMPSAGAPTAASLLPSPPSSLAGEAGRPEQRVPMTRLRARVAERLLEAQQNAAMLTTFNEVDMSAVMALRAQYRDRFEQTHQVRLGFMSFFVKAAVEALQRFPVVNASIDGSDILYHGYYDIGIAVSSPRGLVVPVLRDCDQLGMAEIEKGIGDFGQKAKDGGLSFEELTGGTFTITNGGIFGSMLSTPILNPPQSAILGMHKIQDRPVAVDGQVVIRPMMYLALSYDHRLIDGRDAVQFLVSIKESLEEPARLLLRI